MRPPRPPYAVRVALCAALAALCAAGAAAPAGARPRAASAAATAHGAAPAFDARVADRARGRRARVPQAARAARDAFVDRLGRDTTVDIDPLTGTPRALGRLDGALSGPAPGDGLDVASAWVRDHLDVLGLTREDLGRLQFAERTTSPGGVEHLRWRQVQNGVPVLDADLRVSVDRAGRVLAVTGAPRADLATAPTTPAISASEATAALERALVARGAAAAAGAGGRPGVATSELVLFGGADLRPAWHLTLRTGDAWYDAAVDARTGALLRLTDLVKHAAVTVHRLHPGAGTDTVELTPYLDAGATTLRGPAARLFSDLDDDDVADAGEEVAPAPATFTPVNAAQGSCLAGKPCSWDHTSAWSWTGNRAAAALNAFVLVNRFHDFLAAAPVGFGAADGAFEGADRVIVQTNDGAALDAGLPGDGHADNANMATPPDGTSPVLQLYLFGYRPPLGSSFRDVNAADDAGIVLHEYTHGLSSRLVTDAAGVAALGSPHAAALAEALSDFYAKDFIVENGWQTDTAAPGEIDMGVYVDAAAHAVRTQPMDCPVATAASVCPDALGGAGAGGYTLGDFGRVYGVPEEHGDGEIAGQTLWSLRAALGGALARGLVTEALRLVPPEPTFLDLRNAILQADTALHQGAHRDQIWEVFRSRGMGFFAGAESGWDTSPVEDFSAPPAPGAPSGTLAGRVSDESSGLPVAGAQVAVGGLGTAAGWAGALAGTTGSDGGYALGGVPVATWRTVKLSASGYDVVTLRDVPVAGGATTTRDAALRRNWAASDGGAVVTATTDDSAAGIGCGARAVIDQSQHSGWSAFNKGVQAGDPRPDPQVVVRLPAAIDVSAFGLDPAATCGDDWSAGTRGYRLETSPNLSTWTIAAQGQFSTADAGRLNRVEPPAGAGRGVRYLRLTLLSAQLEADGQSGDDYVDFSELVVYGAPPNVLPSGPLAAPATAAPGASLHLDASAVRDPDSAITGYDWDFDADGLIDASTPGPAVDRAYAGAGTFTPRVHVKDFRGGHGTAEARVVVGGSTAAPLAPPGVITPARPSIVLDARGTRGRIGLRVTCPLRCTVTARLKVSKALARRLRLTTLATRTATVTGSKRLTLRLSARVLRRLRAAGLRRVTVTFTATAKDTRARTRTVSRRATVRR